MMRPDSFRKTDSTVAWWSSIHRHTRGHLSDGTDLDASSRTGATGRNLGRPRKSFVQVFAVEDVVSSQLLFRLGERTVGDHHPAILHADGGGHFAGFKRIGSTQDAAKLGLVQNGPVCRGDYAPCLRSRCLHFLRVDQHHVAHGEPQLMGVRGNLSWTFTSQICAVCLAP